MKEAIVSSIVYMFGFAIFPTDSFLHTLQKIKVLTPLKHSNKQIQSPKTNNPVFSHDELFPESSYHDNYPGSELSWLVKERDACGVGFIADLKDKPSHDVVSLGIKALSCMEHRGACLSDNISGDGSGIMTSIPWDLIEKGFGGKKLAERENRGLGMVFLPTDKALYVKCKNVIESEFGKDGLSFEGWRSVPVDENNLGPEAKKNQPKIEQFIVSSTKSKNGDELERILYLRRRITAKILFDLGLDWHQDMYFCSISSRTVVYKGMTNANSLSLYYLDLQDELYQSKFCIYHRRFSTNTMPRWPLAQPMRMLGHNGEINTLLGNINWVRSRESKLGKKEANSTKLPENDAKSFIEEHDFQQDRQFEAIVDNNKSDSANFDSTFELMVESGKSPMEALMVLVPEAYKNKPSLQNNEQIKSFYRFWEAQQEPWDGPALLVWSDGKWVGACLDRNGLRPARYLVTKKGLVCMMSETGVLTNLEENDILEKGRLGPGQMIACDLTEGEFYRNDEIKKRVASKRPYKEWVDAHMKELLPQKFSQRREYSDSELIVQQKAFGWSSEDVDMQIADMASTGKETTFCMGDDIPLAVLSSKPHTLFDYFKQRFAQVTNPPIDPLREGSVMSLEISLGKKGNPMKPLAEDAKQLKIASPLLNSNEVESIYESDFKSQKLSTLYDLSNGPNGLEKAVASLTEKAKTLAKNGVEIIVLSDREGVSSKATYIPPLLAMGAVHHALIKTGLRMDTSIILESGQIWSTHHLAALIGYGASAVHPYLAFEAVRSWHNDPRTHKMMENNKLENIRVEKAQENFRKAMEAGLLKVMSKMGISLITSYQGAQIFEAIGISNDLVELAFKGTPSRLGGITISDLANETARFVESALSAEEKVKLINYGYVQSYRTGEYHHNSPVLMKSLHKAIKQGNSKEGYDLYQLYMESVRSRPITSLRDLLELDFDREPIELDQVESAESIMARFCTGGMSLGALSREAHETLAIGVNRVGGKSNSGEGGEDPIRFEPLSDVDGDGHSPTFSHLKGLRNGDLATSAIKQVASGRFGVTPEYLMSAKQIEIKMGQGAKPGEGGQLPGKKVDDYIAGLRLSKPGVTLISPPPHHDIYSIEDLAQLIFDLHQINPEAGVSVKLVSEVGIGTVAAGVAKANADVIQISGHDGGTGASPLSSIKHAGSPWELGLAEVHRTLFENNLRDRTLLRVDGGLKTGLDVLIAALMGAEEFGFGTIAMIAEGCIMARICHTNGCPVGITTQNERLRKKFPGTPDNIVTFFQFVAEEIRMLLAKLGYKSLQEVIGRADLLSPRADVSLEKSEMLNLNFITKLPNVKSNRNWLNHGAVNSNRKGLDDELLEEKEIKDAIETPGYTSIERNISNSDRTVGARIAGKIAKKWGNKGFLQRNGSLQLNFKGSAGQSFAAFIIEGMQLRLEGEANDYVGKGMNGGVCSIFPPLNVGFNPSDAVIVGNTCLYGATGGSLFVQGRAGERFAVRNSAAKAVVEGSGDHLCEYMTGGIVVSIGPCGSNIGAGMTGGIAYVLDEIDDGSFHSYVNQEIVKIQRIESESGAEELKKLLKEHVRQTDSIKASCILKSWDDYRPKFWQLVPPAESKLPIACKDSEISSKGKKPLTASIK